MSKVYEFIKDCGTFFVLTLNDDFPAGRPFGAIMEIGEDLYISTSDSKSVYKQLKTNGNMQLLALKPGTRDWVRVTGVAEECDSLEIRKKMLKDCSILKKHYPSADTPHFNVFKISIISIRLY